MASFAAGFACLGWTECRVSMASGGIGARSSAGLSVVDLGLGSENLDRRIYDRRGEAIRGGSALWVLHDALPRRQEPLDRHRIGEIDKEGRDQVWRDGNNAQCATVSCLIGDFGNAPDIVATHGRCRCR